MPLDAERSLGLWVGMSAADPSVTASHFCCRRGLSRSLALFFPSPSPPFAARDKIYGEEVGGGGASHGLGLSLSGSSAPSAVLGRWGGGGDLGENVDYCCNRYCCCQLTCSRTGRRRNWGSGWGSKTQLDLLESPVSARFVLGFLRGESQHVDGLFSFFLPPDQYLLPGEIYVYTRIWCRTRRASLPAAASKH